MMLQNIHYTLNELKLYFRFTCRKVGVPGYQIHQIRLPEHQLIYIPIPKNACTSVKQALHYIQFGEFFTIKDKRYAAFKGLHDFYNKRPEAFTGIRRLEKASDFTKFAVVRDPVERLISCYRNRVVDLGDLQSDAVTLQRMNLSAEPDLNTFVLNLKKYREASKSIEHHCRYQSSYLADSLNYLDHIYPIEQIDKLYEMLQTYSSDLKMLNRKSGGTEIDVSDLSQEALEYALQFYQMDYKLLRKFYRAKNLYSAHTRQT